MIRQITIIGTGLIGGSLALALKKGGYSGRVLGCDRAGVAEKAKALGVVDEAVGDAREAVRGSQVVVLATPVGGILDLVERIGPVLDEGAILTDVGSTKAEICARAKSVFGDAVGRKFLPGHPMAGKERSGIEQADGGLYLGAVWLFTPYADQKLDEGVVGEYVGLVRSVGANVITMDPERHDLLCAWISHLPQMVAIALAGVLQDELAHEPDLPAVGGRALREMTRIAASPYSWWRDVAMTNTENLQQALMKLEQRLGHIRENLRTAALREEFDKANEFRRSE